MEKLSQEKIFILNFMIENLYAGFLNMDHRTDRLQHMENQFSRLNIKPIRHRGKKPQEYNLSDPKVQTMLNRTPGAIGCHFGQVEIMKTALGIGANAMVLEDDIKFSTDFNERLEYIDNWTKTHEWDVIWLGASFHSASSPIYPFWHPNESQTIGGMSRMSPDCSSRLGRDCEPTDDPRIIRTFGAYITFAYIVNVNSIENILNLFDEHLHTSIGIDWLFIKLQPQLKCFSFVPGCVMQIDNMSDQKEVQEMTVWSGQLNNGPYVFQNRMEYFDPTNFKWI
jgi:GR25 family glycosyltransferase involved in LPS biosynthesis